MRNSKDITRAELIKMVATLRGTLYGIVNDPVEPPDEEEVRSVLGQTEFGVDGDSFDEPEVWEENQTDDVEYLRAFIGELRRVNRGLVDDFNAKEQERLSDNAKSYEAIGELVECIAHHVKRDHWPRLCVQLVGHSIANALTGVVHRRCVSCGMELEVKAAFDKETNKRVEVPENVMCGRCVAKGRIVLSKEESNA